eukprot:m.162465 g.162465  ORF g.162465 m.162465 type:complete len:72 (+) comp18069_c0_seq8:1036-1251(+)
MRAMPTCKANSKLKGIGLPYFNEYHASTKTTSSYEMIVYFPANQTLRPAQILYLQTQDSSQNSFAITTKII